MKNKLLRHTLALVIFGISSFATAAPEPEAYEGTAAAITAKLITISGPLGAKVFEIDKAGVCGWPSKKRCADVFKVGDKVIAYYFGDPASKRAQPALNILSEYHDFTLGQQTGTVDPALVPDGRDK